MEAPRTSSGTSLEFWRVALPSLAVALVLTTIFIGSITGLHGDEAWVVLRVAEIANGSRPFSGMNYYTGALNAYLAWPFLAATGYQFWALRLASALLNTLAVLIALDIVRTLHPDDPAVWRWTGALWVTSVPFVVYSRFAVEVNMLTPVLILGAIWLLTVALRSESAAQLWLAGLGSGFMLAVAVYNHVVELSVVMALGVGALGGFGFALFRRRVTWLVIAGFGVGLIPTALRLVFAAHQSAHHMIPQAGPTSFSHEVSATISVLIQALPSLGKLIRELEDLPGVMANLIDGGAIFQRFTGERLVPVIPYFSVALAGLGAAAIWRSLRQRMSHIDRAMLIAWLAMPIAVLVLAPTMTVGYFAFPALVAPYVLVRFALPLVNGNDASSLYGRIGRGVLLAVLTIQIGYLTTDYFFAFARSGGRASRVNLGSSASEPSADFIRSDRLYRQLVAAGVREVISSNLLGWSLEAQDLQFHHLLWTPGDGFGLAARAPQTKVGRVAFINHKLPPGNRLEWALVQMERMPRFRAGDLVYERASGFDDHFSVFICDRK